MTGSTHAAIGIASSLVILQPKTIPECLCAITGGLIGGLISDIDSPGKRKSLDYSEDLFGWQIYVFVGLAVAILLGLDYFAGNGAMDYVINNFGAPIIVGAIAFLGVCFYGAHTNHRSFTHSVIAGILFTISVWCFCMPLSVPFAIGFVSHLFIDFFNRKKVQYFWPLPFKNGLNKFPSDGKLNDFLCGIGTIISIFLFSYFFINSFANSTLAINLLDLFTHKVIILNWTVPFIVPYLIIINVIGFIAYIIDYSLFMRGLFFYKGTDEEAEEMSSFIMTLLLAIDIVGGMIGKLLAVLVLLRGKVYKAEAFANYNLYIIPVCLLISWMAFLLTFYFPTVSSWIKPLASQTVGGIPVRLVVLGYFLIINIVTMVLFPQMQRFAYVITRREKVCMFLSLLGGASGGYLSMKTTGNHQNATMLASTLPEMMVMHAVVLTCVFFSV